MVSLVACKRQLLPHIAFRQEAILAAEPLTKAIRQYWEGHGHRCPDRLAELVPDYIEALPPPPDKIHITGWRYRRRGRESLTMPPSCELVIIPSMSAFGWPPYLEHPYTGQEMFWLGWVYWPEEEYPTGQHPRAYFGDFRAFGSDDSLEAALVGWAEVTVWFEEDD